MDTSLPPTPSPHFIPRSSALEIAIFRATVTMYCHPFLLAAPQSLSTCTDPTHLLKSPLLGLQPALRSQEVQADTQGLPTQTSPSASGSRGCLGGLDPQNKNPFCSLQRLLPRLELGTVAAFSSGRRRSAGRRCGGRAGQPRFLATRAASPSTCPLAGRRAHTPDLWSGPAGLAYLRSASGERPRRPPPELCKERALC